MTRGTTPKTKQVKKHGHLLSEIDTLNQLLSECWTSDEALEWLFSPHPSLKGKTPMMMLVKGRLEDVNQHLEKLLDGQS